MTRSTAKMTPQEVRRRRIVRERERRDITGIGPTTAWRLEALGQFPRRVRLTSKSVGWYEDELLEWVESRGASRSTAPAGGEARS